jgi:gluconolactonase
MVEIRTLAAGIGFTEGPLWTRDGRLLVASVSRGLVVELDPASGRTLGAAETGGGPNGLAEDSAGWIWVAQNGGTVVPSRSQRPASPGLQRVDGTTVHDVITTGQRAPNDIVEAPDGSLWFTDPGPPGDTGHGRLCSYDPDTGAVLILLDGIDFPNGLAFGPSGDVLHLAETATGRVVRYRWDGVALHRDGLSAVLPEGGPDGLAVDVEGRLYAAAPDADAVFAFDPDGRPLEPLRFPGRAFPTNLCFAGPQHDELVVTAAKGGRVLRVRGWAPAPGIAPPQVPAQATGTATRA